MIYNTKNMREFMDNYMSADGAGDTRMKRDILISEIAKIIVNNPKKVMGHLKLYGFAVSQNASKDALATTVSRALLKSPRFARQMALEILGGTYGAAGSMDMMTTTPVDSPLPSSPDPAAVSGVSPGPIVSGLGEVFGGTSMVSSPTPTPTPDPGPAANVSGTASGSKTMPPPETTKIIEKVIIPTYIPTYTGGGDGGGSGSPVNDEATEDLKNKVKTMSGDTGWSVKKKIAMGLFLGLVIGGGIYIYKNK